LAGGPASCVRAEGNGESTEAEHGEEEIGKWREDDSGGKQADGEDQDAVAGELFDEEESEDGAGASAAAVGGACGELRGEQVQEGSTGEYDEEGAGECGECAAGGFSEEEPEVPGDEAGEEQPDSGSEPVQEMKGEGSAEGAADIEGVFSAWKDQHGRRISRIIAEKAQSGEDREGEQSQSEEISFDAFEVKHGSGIGAADADGYRSNLSTSVFSRCCKKATAASNLKRP
jgi:hypothetical protein